MNHAEPAFSCAWAVSMANVQNNLEQGQPLAYSGNLCAAEKDNRARQRFICSRGILQAIHKSANTLYG